MSCLILLNFKSRDRSAKRQSCTIFLCELIYFIVKVCAKITQSNHWRDSIRWDYIRQYISRRRPGKSKKTFSQESIFKLTVYILRLIYWILCISSFFLTFISHSFNFFYSHILQENEEQESKDFSTNLGEKVFEIINCNFLFLIFR